MLGSLRNYLISPPKSAKTLVNHLQKVIKKCKRNKPKRAISGFDGLKPPFGSMELSNQIELVFKFIDANGDGKISPLELREFLLCLGHDKSKVEEEAKGMLKHMDSNGDGFVDLDEYKGVVMMVGDDDRHHHKNDDDDDDDDDDDAHHHDEAHHHHHGCGNGQDGNLEDELRDAFLVFDVDENGLISASELQDVLKRLGFANCSLEECNLMIKGVDKDGDGFVNFDEFRIMMMGHARK